MFLYRLKFNQYFVINYIIFDFIKKTIWKDNMNLLLHDFLN